MSPSSKHTSVSTVPAGSDPACTDSARPDSAEPAAVRTVVIPVDLHARPAGRLTRAAAGFEATTMILAGERCADARSVLAVMSLGATAGAEVTVRSAGPDADAAVDALAAVLATAD